MTSSIPIIPIEGVVRLNFFGEWERNLENMKYFHAFLSEKEYVNRILRHGLLEEEKIAFRVLQQIPLEQFIDCICRLHPKHDFCKSDVPIFSDFEKSVIRVPELLEFAEHGLTFDELGYQLMGCAKEAAQKKYGENQGKIAELCGLAEIGVQKPRKVTLTSWGKYLVSISMETKMTVLRKMILRNAYLQCLISKAASGPVLYTDTVSCLAPSNQGRRRGNVRYLMEFILKGSKRESILRNIDWRL